MKKKKENKPTIDLMFNTETFSRDIEHGMVVNVGIESFSLEAGECIGYGNNYFITPESSKLAGRIEDERTMEWWKSKAHIEEFHHLQDNIRKRARSFDFVWDFLLTDWRILAKDFQLRVWSKDKNFDFPIIESSLRDAGLIKDVQELPYSRENIYDARTIIDLALNRGWKDPWRDNYHDALNDCINQFHKLQDAFAFLQGRDLWDR